MSDEPTAFDWINSLANQAQNPEQDQQELERQQLEALEMAQRIKRVFVDNPDGKALLDHMVQATLLTPMMNVTKEIPINGEVALSPSDWAYLREGQNSVIHWLRANIEAALNPPAPQENTDNG